MKYKTIKINEELHKKLKHMCNEQGLKLNWWCEWILKKSANELLLLPALEASSPLSVASPSGDIFGLNKKI